jgi:hypothetical protein
MRFETERKLMTAGLVIRRILCFGLALLLVAGSVGIMFHAFQIKDLGLGGVSLGILGMAAYLYHLGRYGQRHLGKIFRLDEKEHEEQKRKYGWRW